MAIAARPATRLAARPRFALTLREKKSPHMLERTPRYDVLVNDKVQGELYFNMRGYVGYLPTVRGSVMDIGERPISAFRKEAMILNREAIRTIEATAADPRRITQTWPTSDSSTLLARSESVILSEVDFHHIPRKAYNTARALFGDDVGLAFFGCDAVKPSPEGPVALIPESEGLPGKGFENIPVRLIDAAEADLHERAVERVIDTVDPQVKLVIGRRMIEDAEPEPYFVDRVSLELGRGWFKDALRIGDLRQVAPAEILHEDDKRFLETHFPAFERETAPDPDYSFGPE